MNDFQTNEKNDIKIHAEHVDFFYGKKQTLFDINLDFRDREVTALIGLRQKYVFKNAFAHERTHPRHPHHGENHVGRR